MLEIDSDFAKKVAVPAISDVHELATVLQEMKVFNSGDINQVVNHVQERTGSDRVGVGIKAVQDYIFEAKAGGSGGEVVETFTDLLTDRIQEMSIS